MSQEPRLQPCAAQHYIAIPAAVAMQGIPAVVDQAFPRLLGWLDAAGVAPAGPPFIRYLVIDMAGELRLELGVPVGIPVSGDRQVQPGVLPAGTYAVLRHTGPYDGLVASNAALQRWARARGLKFDRWDTSGGEAWRARVEHYITDPAAEPDPAKWEADIAYLTRE